MTSSSGWICGVLNPPSILLLLALKLLPLDIRDFLLECDQYRERIHVIRLNPEPAQAIVFVDLVQQVFLVKGCPGRLVSVRCV